MNYMGNKKYLFLDVDGVLNHAGCRDWMQVPDGDPMMSWRNDSQIKKSEDGNLILEGLWGMEADCVARLNRIIEAVPDVQVVLSSTWRLNPGLKVTEANLRRQGYQGPSFIGKTPAWGLLTRGHEIRTWLDKNAEGYTDKDIVILDDTYDMADLSHRLVLTSFHVGLTDANVNEAVHMLLGGTGTLPELS
jgi:hypothetical protein